jgi:hypothetical protein
MFKVGLGGGAELHFMLNHHYGIYDLYTLTLESVDRARGHGIIAKYKVRSTTLNRLNYVVVNMPKL